jgi:hypothetical protein
MMTDWQQRVVQEKTDLDEKIAKLRTFLTDGRVHTLVVAQEYARLTLQLAHMLAYSDVLGQRIAACCSSSAG